jgi:hypothetical protein
MNEDPGRHIRVSDQVMRLADQFVMGETADGHKRFIAVSDSAIKVGCGDQPLFGGEESFMLGYGQIHTHKTRSFFGLLLCFGGTKEAQRHYG